MSEISEERYELERLATNIRKTKQVLKKFKKHKISESDLPMSADDMYEELDRMLEERDRLEERIAELEDINKRLDWGKEQEIHFFSEE